MHSLSGQMENTIEHAQVFFDIAFKYCSATNPSRHRFQFQIHFGLQGFDDLVNKVRARLMRFKQSSALSILNSPPKGRDKFVQLRFQRIDGLNDILLAVPRIEISVEPPKGTDVSKLPRIVPVQEVIDKVHVGILVYLLLLFP